MNKPRVVIASKSGQLGNRIILFAHFIANAIEYGYELYNPNFDEYCLFFDSTTNNNFDGYPITVVGKDFINLRQKKISERINFNTLRYLLLPSCKILKTKKRYELSDKYFLDLLERKKNIITYGWLFRDRDNFNKYLDILKKIFSPIEIHARNVDRLIQNCRSDQEKNKLLIGVHIRRGDYQTFQGGKYYYENSVYLKYMTQIYEIFQQEQKSVAFLLCSNESISEVFNQFEVYTGTGHLIEDLYCLAKCDYLMGPTSTYTSWASIYGNVPLCHLQTRVQVLQLSDFKVFRE
jgi:hypothetical protein